MIRFDTDKAGAFASFLCAIHCAAVGLAAGILPFIGLTFLHEPWVEATFFGMAIFFGIWATVRGYRLHKTWWTGLLFGVGLILITVGHLAAENSSIHNLELVGHLLSATGGLTLVAFHVFNAKLTKSHACSCRACKTQHPD